MPIIDRAPCEIAQPAFQAAPRGAGDCIFARLHGFHVDNDVALDPYAEVGRVSREIRRIGARNQRLGWNTTRIDAGPAKSLALNDRDLSARCYEAPGERWSRLASSNDDSVVFGHGVSPDCNRTMGVFRRTASTAATARASAIPATQAAQPKRSNNCPSTALPTSPPEK